MKDNICRFSSRADIYDKFRPKYPPALYDFLHEEAGISGASTVADIAAGTGLFTEGLRSWGCPLVVVEPNHAMRAFAYERLREYHHVQYFADDAEDLTLPVSSVDLFTVAQAFHWFDIERTKKSFLRVAKPHAKVALIWNRRNFLHDFEAAYEALIVKYAVDYEQCSQQNTSQADILQFFRPVVPIYKFFEHTTPLDFESLWGRTQSYSFLPDPSATTFETMKAELSALFDQYQYQGKVVLGYESRVFIGPLATD